MKNIIDSSLRFSVITEDSLIQTYVLDASLDGPTQQIPYTPNSTYLLQEFEQASIEDTLVATRSGEDLLIAFRNQEHSQPALNIKDFFTHNGQLHVMKQDGEFIRNLSAQDNPQQGPVNFDAQSLGVIEQQPQQRALGMLHEVTFSDANTVPAPVTEPAAPKLMMAALLTDDAPKITNALDQIGTRQGSMKSGNVTDDQWAVLEGTGKPGVSLDIIDNGLVIGNVRVDTNGHWRFEPEEKLSESGHVFTARDTSSGTSSDSFVLIVDSVAPSRAVIDNIINDRDGNTPIQNNGYTSDNTPVIKGRAEAFSMVAIYSGKAMLGTAFADATGAWEFSSAFTFPDGVYNITAKAIDFSGNTGLASTTYKITIDTIPPAVPTILQAFDDAGALQGNLTSGALTDDRTPTLSGKAEAGVTVFVYDNGKLLGTTNANVQGVWSFTPSSNLTDGEHQFTTTARDQAGNLSTESDAFTLQLGEDRTTTPTIDSVTDDVGSIQGALLSGAQTDDATPTLRGKAHPGDKVQIFDNGRLLGETEANAQGNWSFTPKSDLSEGAHSFQVQASNASQSASERSPAFDLVLDLTAPDASNLRITGVYDDVGDITGNVVPGGRTDDRNPGLSGTGPAGETVIIYNTDATGQHEIGRVKVGSNGIWFLEVKETLGYGTNIFTAVAVDVAGNATPHSPGYKVTVTTNDMVGGYDLGSNQSSGGSINTTVVGHQNNPQVTKLANGNLVVVWQGVNSGSYDVYMQLMDPTGKEKIGSEHIVNQRTNNNQDSAQVVALADGGFLVVFESYGNLPDNSGDGVYARQYNAQGVAQTDEFLVNQTIAGAQRAAGALALPDGGYIVSWYSDQNGGSIMQRTYNANSQPLGGEVFIKTGGAGASNERGGPEMVLLGDSGWYLTVWTGNDSNSTGVNGQLRKVDGSATGPNLILNTTQDNAQNYPDVIALKDGSFVVFWDSNDSKAVGSDIRAAHYTFDPVTGSATVVGNGDFIVNEYRAGKQYKPVGVALDDGGYMLIWGSEGGDGDGSAIFAQRFDASSNKIGHEFLVNPTTWGNQGSGWDNIDLTHILDATLQENGNVFITWHSEVIDRDGYGIEGVSIDIDAGFYSEFQVNRVINNNQTQPSTTALPDGNFVVIWQSAEAGNWDIKAQLFNDQGMPIGDETLLSQDMKAYDQFDASLTTLADGTFVVAWASADVQNTIRMVHYGYKYDDHGQVIGTKQIGSEQVVNPNAGKTGVGKPFITPLEDGGYLVSWHKDVSGWSIVSRQYDAHDQPVTGEIVVGISGQIYSGSVSTTLTDGNVAIADSVSGNGFDIHVRLYNPITHTYGPAFVANQTLPGNQGTPSITSLANGNFVVAWDSNNNGGRDQSSRGVYARVYSPTGTALTNELLVNTYTVGAQQRPVLKANPNGGFVAVYESEADLTPGAGTAGIYLQFFDDNGHRVGQEMHINQIVVGAQLEPDIAFLPDGRLFVTWTDYGVGDGSYSSIKGRIIDLDSSLGQEVTVNGSTTNNGIAPLMLADNAEHGSLWMLFDDGSTSGLLLSGESLSTVRGGAGDDVIGISNTSFAAIHGGDGIDTLLLDGKNMALDLDALIGRITGIEKIDLGQGSANSLSLSASALEELGQTNMVMADGKNQLVINGDGSNALQLLDTQSESWAEAGQAEIGGVVYHTYVAGATELLVEQNIHVTVM